MMPNPWMIIGALAIWIASAVGGFTYGVHEEREAQEVRLAKMAERARIESEQKQAAANKINGSLKNEIDRLNTDLVVALDQLRKRPERMPEATRATCQGSSGAELSGPDSQFLVREAARADRFRAELKACYEWSETVMK